MSQCNSFIANVWKRLNMSHATIGDSSVFVLRFYASFLHFIYQMIAFIVFKTWFHFFILLPHFCWAYAQPNFRAMIQSTVNPMWHKRMSPIELITPFGINDKWGNGRIRCCLLACTITHLTIFCHANTIPHQTHTHTHNQPYNYNERQWIQFDSIQWKSFLNAHKKSIWISIEGFVPHTHEMSDWNTCVGV